MPPPISVEQAGFWFLLGALTYGLFASALIIQNHQKTWCPWCKMRHNPKQFK